MEEAQTLLRSRDFDVVISEVEVAGRNGNKGLREWIERERPALADRLIVMSALAEAAHSPKTSSELVLQKPFDALQLLGAIESALTRAKSPAAR